MRPQEWPTRRITCALVSVLLLGALACQSSDPNESDTAVSEEYVLDAETLGLFRYIHDISMKPGLDPVEWGVLIPGAFGGMGYYQRYVLAFTAYAVAQTCEHTPAYRQPCIEALDALIEKMLDRQIWEDWLLQEWGGSNPLYPYNIMYTGHLLLMMALHERLAHDGKYLGDVELVFDPQTKFTTNLRSLARDISSLMAENRDASGRPYYAIACETDRVFVPCNSIPHYGLNLLASMGEDISTESTAPWLNWVKANAYDAKTGYILDMFVPSESTVAQRPSGTWTAWSLAYMDALDSEWAQESYSLFKAHAVKKGVAGEGTAVILDSPVAGSSSPRRDAGDGTPHCPHDAATPAPANSAERIISVLDLLPMAFGLLAAREMGDEPLYREFLAGWDSTFGEPRWTDDGRHFGYFSIPYLTAASNGFALLARSLTRTINLKYVIEHPRPESFYSRPYVSSVTDPSAFVHRAAWSENDRTLHLVLSGGYATQSSTEILIANVPSGSTVSVTRGGGSYDRWTREGDSVRLQIEELSPTVESYSIRIERD